MRAWVQKQRGVVAVVTLVMLVVLLGCTAFSVDVGYLFNVRAELQNAADAAALAGASGIPGGSAEIRARVHEFASKQVGLAKLKLTDNDIVLGRWDSKAGIFTPVIDEEKERVDSVKVSADMESKRGNPVPLFFASIFGKSETDISARATASFGTADTWDVIIVQDVSGSFTDALGAAKQADEALIECLKDHTNNASRLGLVTFTGSEYLIHALDTIESGYDSLITKVRNLKSCCWFSCGSRPKCSTGTHIAAGLNMAIDEFLMAGLPDPDIGRAIVLVSDGRPQSTASGVSDEELRDQAEAAADRAWSEGITIFTVYYAGSSSTPEEDVKFLETLIRGKGTFSATPNPEDLTTLVWRVCASLPLMLVE